MSKKRHPSILCFSVNKTDPIYDELNNCHVFDSVPPMSRSFHDKPNYFESVPVQITNRPLPPPYDEYAQSISNAKQNSGNLKRSLSSYSTANEKSYSYKDLSDDGFSQYSEGDPPRLIDESCMITPNTNNGIIRPKSLRPNSPITLMSALSSTAGRRKSLSHHKEKQTESPGADSGVRLTPSENEYYKMKKIPDYLDGKQEELKALKSKNNTMSMKELSNENVMNRASFFIERLRQNLKEKNREIVMLQNKLNENGEKLRIKGLECRTLQLELDERTKQRVVNENISTKRDVGCQTTIQHHTTKFPIATEAKYHQLLEQFDEERTKWLEEKANVISYHKQLNRKYQHLLDHNRQLESELLLVQQKLMFSGCNTQESGQHHDIDAYYANSIDNMSDIDDMTDRCDGAGSGGGGGSGGAGGNNSLSRVVKLEESLC